MSNNSSRPLSRLIARVCRFFYVNCTCVIYLLVLLPFTARADSGLVFTNTSVTVPFQFFDFGAGAIRIIDCNTYATSDYFPLRSGSLWTYRYPNGSVYTMKVLPGTFLVNGIGTKAIQDTDGYTQYFRNDAYGIRLHGQFHAPSGITSIYTPPITLAYASQCDNDTATSSGTAQTSVGNFSYSSSFTTAFTPVQVTVPLRTFTAAIQTGTIAVAGQTTSFTINAAKRVGIVKELQVPYDPAGTIELVASNVKTPNDYDGDGEADIGVYRDGSWLIIRSSDGGVTNTGWGGLAWKRVGGDYDGDGIADIAVYNSTVGVWSIIRSSDGVNRVTPWGGAPQDVPLPKN